MIKIEKLKFNNLEYLKILNNKSKDFNKLNEDFFECYNKCSKIKRIFLYKNILLLKEDNIKCLGFVWFDRISNENLQIKSIYVDNENKSISELLSLYKMLISKNQKKYNILFQCEKNNLNYYIFNNLNFIIKDGTIEMQYEINDILKEKYPSYIEFEQFQKNKHEAIRCLIQNNVFYNKDREPLTVEDIFFEEKEKYFWEEGSFFIKKENEYIGYAQIIFQNFIPNIVNFGIMPLYRGHGYGEYLLIHILNFLYKNNYTKANIKVKSTNKKAINLYKKLGFKEVNEIIIFKSYKK